MHRTKWHHIILFLAIFLFGLSISYSQDKKSEVWRVTDLDMNSKFIEEYLNLYYSGLANNPNLAGGGVQKDMQLIVKASLSANEITSYSVNYKNQFLHSTDPLNPTILGAMSVESIANLLGRKYKWTDVDLISIKDDEDIDLTDVDNIFRERNYKHCRDVNWWSRNEIDIASNLHWVVRFKYSSTAFVIEPGLPIIGYPAGLSRLLNIGVSSEVVKAFLTVPWKPIYQIGGQHPIEGAWGGGYKFDTHRIGGMVGFQDITLNAKSLRRYHSPNSIVFVPKYALLYFSVTFGIPGIEKDVTTGPNSLSGRTSVWPSGSLRTRVGFKLIEYSHGIINDEGTYEAIMNSAGLSNVGLHFRAEYVADKNTSSEEIESNSNEYIFAAQINYDLDNQLGLGVEASYHPYRTIKLGLNVAYMGPKIFEWEKADGSLDNFEWKPGWTFTPYFAVNF